MAGNGLEQWIPTVSVGMLTADLLALGSEIKILEQSGVKLVHFDVMDGIFCPMLTLGPPLIKAVKTTMLKDVHLMVKDPIAKLEACVSAGADMITIHAESTPRLQEALDALGTMKNANDPKKGILRGVALNPDTRVETLAPFLGYLDLILILAVHPGLSGQSFLPGTQAKVKKAQNMIRNSGRKILLGVDGGIKRDNIGTVAGMGCDLVVTGSAVFDGKDPSGNASFMLESMRDSKRTS